MPMILDLKFLQIQNQISLAKLDAISAIGKWIKGTEILNLNMCHLF